MHPKLEGSRLWYCWWTKIQKKRVFGCPKCRVLSQGTCQDPGREYLGADPMGRICWKNPSYPHQKWEMTTLPYDIQVNTFWGLVFLLVCFLGSVIPNLLRFVVTGCLGLRSVLLTRKLASWTPKWRWMEDCFLIKGDFQPLVFGRVTAWFRNCNLGPA